MVEILVRLFVRFRPQEGWPPLLLVLTAVLCLPASIALARQGRDAGGLFLLAMAAIAAALPLARSRLQARAAAPAGGLLGAMLAVAVAGRLLPPAGLLWREALSLFTWLRDLPRSAAARPLPLGELGGYLGQQLQVLGTRLWWWRQAAAGSGQVQATDPVIGELLVALLIWGCAFYAVWQIYRRRRALAGLLPAGTLTAVIVFSQDGLSLFYLFTLLFCTLWLIAICHLWRERERWEQTGTDYPDGLGQELTFGLAPWLIAILIVASLFPVVKLYAAREAFWQRMDTPWSHLESLAERYVGPLDTGPALGPRPGRARAGEPGALPQAHLLGSGPELGDIVVLRVRTGDPPPPVPEVEGEAYSPYPRRYWRRSTFDTYTGQGWINASLESRPLQAGERLAAEPPPGEALLQQFEATGSPGPWLYAANAPYRLDHAAEAWRRPPGEVVQLTGSAATYTVLSYTPQPEVAELRTMLTTTSTLPAEIAGLYLTLPEELPARVLALAREVAGEAPGHYERARRIEAYLRRYPYNLDLPEPPGDRDLVDYFLFDLQEGYCDYYASAMAVMARAAGLPARLATGYAQGSYDYETGQWVVTEQDGHSWVEIYFEGIGWVEFEPTAGQPALERPGGGEAMPVEVPPLPPRALRWWQRLPWGVMSLVGAALLLLAAMARAWRPRSEMPAAALVRDRYGRLLRWGRRLGLPLRDGQTPSEYAHDLGNELGTRGTGSPLGPVRQAAAEAPAEVERLAESYVQAAYAPPPLPERQGWQARAVWQRLRRYLLALWVAAGKGREGDRV